MTGFDDLPDIEARNETQQAICDALRGELVTRPKWDEPPEMFLLALAQEQGKPVVTLFSMPLEKEHWHMVRPSDVVYGLAEFAEETGFRNHAEADTYGAVLRTESWLLKTDPEAPDGQRIRAQRAHEDREIYKHPDRTEIRMIDAVDRQGNHYHLQLERKTRRVRQLIHFAGPSGAYQATGDIPDSLNALVRAFLGVEVRRQEPGYVPPAFRKRPQQP